MKVLSVVSQKGGVGKTTLATALAVQATAEGKNAVIFDLDPQASATFWKDTRADDTIAITAVPAARLSHMLAAVREAGCDLAIVDTPPFSKDIAFEAASHADFVLVPTRPAVLDVMAMTRTLDVVKHYRRKFGVVLTFCPRRAARSRTRSMSSTSWGPSFARLGSASASLSPAPSRPAKPRRKSSRTVRPRRKLKNYTRMCV